MNLRYSLLFGVALATAVGTGHAQSRSREDLLDELTRHIQICAEITDNQQRLACYDKVQTHVGEMPSPARQPTPLANTTPPPSPPPAAASSTPPNPPAASGGSSMSGTPLAPPPLMTPGGGVATLGGPQGQAGTTAPPTPDSDRAFNPRDAASSYGSAGGTMPKPQPMLRRTGPRPIPHSSQPMPLVTLTASNLTYGESRYWQVSVSVTSNTPDTVETQIQCTFRNAGRSVGDAYLGPISLAPGEQVSTELIGPPTTTYVDSTNCRVLSP